MPPRGFHVPAIADRAREGQPLTAPFETGRRGPHLPDSFVLSENAEDCCATDGSRAHGDPRPLATPRTDAPSGCRMESPIASGGHAAGMSGTWIPFRVS